MSSSTTETDETRIKRFLAIASHDLQSPLRHIAMYAEILLDEIGDSVDGEHLEYLRTILAKTQAAQELTKGLIGFASGTPRLAVRDVDTRLLVGQIWAELRFEVDAPKATIEMGDLPGVRTDAGILGLVLKNVMANGLMHRADADEACRLTIEAEVDASQWAIHIADNGPGIAREHQENIFTAFWSLQPEGAARRPGLGLAAARELVTALGGSISLQTSAETGSRFTISLPVQ